VPFGAPVCTVVPPDRSRNHADPARRASTSRAGRAVAAAGVDADVIVANRAAAHVVDRFPGGRWRWRPVVARRRRGARTAEPLGLHPLPPPPAEPGGGNDQRHDQDLAEETHGDVVASPAGRRQEMNDIGASRPVSPGVQSAVQRRLSIPMQLTLALWPIAVLRARSGSTARGPRSPSGHLPSTSRPARRRCRCACPAAGAAG